MKSAEQVEVEGALVNLPPPGGMWAALGQWVHDHDDRKLFIIPYVGLALVLSIMISLFWLVALVGLHFAFELYKQQRIGPQDRLSVFVRASWAIFLDLGLVFFALTVAIYIDVVFGLLGLSVAARAGVQGGARLGSRVVAWESVIRGVAISADEALLLSRAIRGKKRAASLDPAGRWGGWTERWPLGAKVSFGFTVGSLCLLLLAPFITPHDIQSLVALVGQELTPFP